MNAINKQKLSGLFNNIYYPYRIFTTLGISFLVGVTLASMVDSFSVSTPLLLVLFSTLLLTSFLNYLFRNYLFVLLALSLVFVLLGVIYFQAFDAKRSFTLPFGEEITLVGKVASNIEKDITSQKVIVSGKAEDKSIRLLINYSTNETLLYGDNVTIRGVLTDPQKLGRNYALTLRGKQIQAVVDQPVSIEVTSRQKNIFEKVGCSSYAAVNLFENSINHIISEPQASLAAGLVLGIKRNIPDQIMQSFQITGLTHIIALSGFNISVILVILMSFFIRYFGRKQAFLYGLILITLFVFMTGASSSIVRAAIFSLVLFLGRVLGRRGDNTNILILTAVAMVLVNPYVIVFDLGFELSFLAFAGLLYFSPSLKEWLRRRWKKMPEMLASSLSETLGAQIAVLPIMAFKFNQISLIAPISNLLILWVIPLAMLLSFLAGLSGIFSLTIGKLFGLILWPVLEYIIKMADMLSAIPLASVNFR